MEKPSITVTLKRLSGKEVVRSDWQCQNGRELLKELERLDTLIHFDDWKADFFWMKLEQLQELGGAQGFEHPKEFLFAG